jgi:hypothetical protein
METVSMLKINFMNVLAKLRNLLVTPVVLPHQKQHHVPYSLAILLNGTF